VIITISWVLRLFSIT